MTREEVLDEINVIYERLSHPEDCENGVYSFRDGNYLEALEVLIDYYEVGTIKELEKIKEEFEEYGSIWVQYSIKGHTNKDIEDIVNDVLKQAKQSFIQKLDNHISELKGENK